MTAFPGSTADIAKPISCPYCGLVHPAKCPSIKAYEYDAMGKVKRIEFFGPNDYAPMVVYGPHGTEIPVQRQWWQDPIMGKAT